MYVVINVRHEFLLPCSLRNTHRLGLVRSSSVVHPHAIRGCDVRLSLVDIRIIDGTTTTSACVRVFSSGKVYNKRINCGALKIIT